MFFHFFAHSTVVPYPDSALTIFDIYFFPYQVCKPANKLCFPVLSGSRILHIFAKWQIWLFLVHWINPILFTVSPELFFFLAKLFFSRLWYKKTSYGAIGDQNSCHNIINSPHSLKTLKSRSLKGRWLGLSSKNGLKIC